jgi:hypothetical protein
MAITVHFRGVGVFVTNGLTVTELLFPNADSRHPPDHETLPNGQIGHADKSAAKKHFAGVLTVDVAGQERNRALIGRRVTFPGNTATRIDASFRKKLPPLDRCTDSPGHKLRLLPEEERKGDRVASRILLAGGQLVAHDPGLTIEFDMDGHFGPAARGRRYAYDVEWTTNDAAVSLEVETFDGRPESPIELSGAVPEAYFYCFDDNSPSKRDLTKLDPTKCTNPPVTDHDFKWIYQLLDRENSNHRRWQDWLQGSDFPAPRTDCVERGALAAARAGEAGLIPVSTCYSTAWDGP